MMAITIGLDLAKRVSWYAAVEESDELVEDGQIPSSPKAFEELVKRFDPETVLVEASSASQERLVETPQSTSAGRSPGKYQAFTVLRGNGTGSPMRTGARGEGNAGEVGRGP